MCKYCACPATGRCIALWFAVYGRARSERGARGAVFATAGRELEWRNGSGEAAFVNGSADGGWRGLGGRGEERPRCATRARRSWLVSSIGDVCRCSMFCGARRDAGDVDGELYGELYAEENGLDGFEKSVL